MHGPGHVGASLLSYAPLGATLAARGRDRLAVVGGLVAVACSTLPDLDEFVPGVEHRGPTHTLWFAVAVGAALSAASAAVAAVCGPPSVRPHVCPSVRLSARPTVRPTAVVAGLAGFLTVATHVAVDALTPMGIRPLAPVRDRDVCFDVVLSRDLRANLLFLAAGVLATVVAGVTGRLVGSRRGRSESWPAAASGGS